MKRIVFTAELVTGTYGNTTRTLGRAHSVATYNQALGIVTAQFQAHGGTTWRTVPAARTTLWAETGREEDVPIEHHPVCTASESDDTTCRSLAVYDTPWGPRCGTHAYRERLRAENLALLPHPLPHSLHE